MSVIPTSSSIQADYMKLLVTQLQNQNPLEPMDNNQMAMQLAQLSQLQQLEEMNSTFSKVLLSQQVGEAADMIGKSVTFMPTGQDFPVSARVESVELERGQVRLRAGGTTLGLEDILSIRN